MATEWLSTAIAEHRAGNVGRAASLYRQILAEDPDNADALHLLGLTDKQGGNPRAAIDLVGRALQINPQMVEARANLAHILAAQGDHAGAVKHWRIYLTLAPGDAQAWAALAASLQDRAEAGRSAAIIDLRRAIRVDPTQPRCYYDLGILLRQDNQIADAIDSYRNAIRLTPDMEAAWMSLGNALLDFGDMAGALSALHRAIGLAPQRPEIWFNLANLHYRQGDLAAALVAYRRAERLGLASARARIVVVLVEQGQHQEAEAALVRYLPLAGTDVTTCLEQYHLLLVREGRQAEARLIFTRLETIPLAGRLYPVECRTALAALDLDAGAPEAALARLVDIESDDCRMFTIRSLAALECTRKQQGWQWWRPVNPTPALPRLQSSSLAYRGRFAHNVLEYVLLRLYAEKHGCVLETPDWVGGAYFDLDDPSPSDSLPPWPFARELLNRGIMTTGDGHDSDPPIVNRDALSPLFLYEYRQEYRDRIRSWLRPRANWSPWIDPPVEALRAAGNTVVAIHIRRGDFLRFGYPITETDWYVDWLRRIWPELDRPVLYLASDDIPSVRAAFKPFRPVTLHDAAPAWPGLEYLQDFHVLTQADIVGVSAASGFSQLAALLNTKARLCVEPDMTAGGIRPFKGWV